MSVANGLATCPRCGAPPSGERSYDNVPLCRNGHKMHPGLLPVPVVGPSDHRPPQPPADLPDQLGESDAFPVEALTEPARSFVWSAARALGVPMGYVGLPFLVAAGALIGNGVGIRIKLGYLQFPILWGIVVGLPGAAKSPALRLAVAPLDAIEQDEYRRWKRAMQAYEEDFLSWEGAPKHERGGKPQPPRRVEYLTTDATLEALAVMVEPPAIEDPNAEATTGVLWKADEAASWILSNNQYKGGRGNDRQRWLEAWAGGSIKINRKTSTITIADPVIAVAGCIQPDVLKTLQPQDMGRDGFVERPLFCYEHADPAPWSEATVDPAAFAAVQMLFQYLRRPVRQATPVTLTPAALREWRHWYDNNQRLVGNETGVMAGVYAKLPVQLSRLALILHALADPHRYHATQVTEATMLAAIELVEYFRVQAHTALRHLGVEHRGGRGGLRGRILQCIRAADGEPVTKRDIFGATGRNMSAAELDAVLVALAADGVIERVGDESTRQGGRPRELWRSVPDANTYDQTNNELTNKPDGGRGG